jgi:hypothetical protein
MKSLLIALVFLATALYASAAERSMSDPIAEAFVADLIEHQAALDKWVHEPELKVSRRLQIEYHGVPNKYLISYDISDDVRKLVKDGVTTPRFEIHALETGYSRLALGFDGIDGEVEYYFNGDKLISPILYYSRNWTVLETDYFVIYKGDPSAFNQYSAERLDSFVGTVLNTLQVPEDRRKRLREKKIYYFLCDGADEIRDLTGYNTRGMYNLAYDYVISTFNCHYHEIVHLLVNYKLEDVYLDTHPFFQEGIAVALGGRGGKEPSPILELGHFLEHSQFASWRDLLSYDSYQSTDASLSYPVMGLYSRFLVGELGIDRYLALYTKYGGAGSRHNIIKNDLPGVDSWHAFLREYSTMGIVEVRPGEKPRRDTIYVDTTAVISQSDDDVHFEIAAPVLLSEAKPPSGFASKIFGELCPGRDYRGEKYLISASDQEISVYNLYTNNLVAKYVPSMSVQALPIGVNGGLFSFSVDRSVFDEDLRIMIIDVVQPVQ